MTAITESAEILQEHETETQRSPSLFVPLKRRDFRLFWIGEGVSVLGTQFHIVAMAFLALGLTGSGLAFGTLLMVASIPRAIFMLVGGGLADRISPRKLMIGSNVARGLLVALLAGMVAMNVVEIWHLYIVAALFGTADALFLPAFQSFFPRLVPEHEREAANGLVQGVFQLTNVFGPALAGILVYNTGYQLAFGIDAVSFVFAATMLTLIGAGVAAQTATDENTNQDEDTESFWTSIWQAIKYVALHPVLRTVVIVVMLINLAINGPFQVGLPVLADTVFDSAKIYGWMGTTFGLGAVVGAITGGSVRRPRYVGRAVALLMIPIGVGTVLMGVFSSLVAYLTTLGMMGLCIGALNVIGTTWFQSQAAESGMMGRVMSLLMLAAVGVNIFSAPLAGWLADLNLSQMFIGAGMLFLLAALGSMFDRNYMAAE